MNTDDFVTGASSAFAGAEELNKRAVPLGYAVLTTAHGRLGREDGETFEAHYSVRPFGAEDGGEDRYFPDLEAVSHYLDHLETLPWWRIDLSDGSVEVDGVELTVTDKSSGETIYLGGGWSWLIAGSMSSGQVIGENLSQLQVRADTPPKFGRWRKVG